MSRSAVLDRRALDLFNERMTDPAPAPDSVLSPNRRPADPVLDFLYDEHVPQLVMQGSHLWPYSRLSRSRLDKIGYRLVVLRCAQIGVEPPTRAEAREWGQS